MVRNAVKKLTRFLGLLIKNKKIKREDYKSHSFSFKREHLCVDLEFAANSIRL